MSTGDEGALSGTSQFVASVVVNVALGIVFCLAFSCLRRRMPWCYDPRRIDTIRNPGYKPGDAYLAPPPRQAKGFFDWIPQSIKMTDDEMLRVAGVDAVMTVRFFRYCFYFFSFLSVFAVAIILPIHYLSDGGMQGFNRMSLSNIPEGSHRTSVNVVFAYIFTFSLLFMLYLLWQANVVSQAKWMANEQFCGRKLTLLVEGLPPAYRSDGKLLRFFQTLFDRGVSGASVVKIAEELQQLTAERDACVAALNHGQGDREMDFKTPYARQQHKLKMCCPTDAEKVDLIDHFTARIREIDEKIANVKASSLKAASCGLVTFTSAAAAASASQVPIVSNFGRFTTRWAPEPREINWSGIRMDPWMKWFMGLVMTVAHFFLVFFWSIPIGFISSLTSLESLGKVLPFLEPLVDMSPPLKGFLEGFLPALAMTIFMAVLPKILAAMGRAQGIECESWIQMYVLRKYFVFQIFNFFLLTALASSIFKQMQDIIDHPTSIVTLLAESIPASANVFIAYVMLRALSANFMELAQVVRWVLCIILGFISSTPEEYVGKWNPDPFKYGKLIPEALLVFTIGFCFAPIQPILVIFVAIFFATGYLVHKYMFAYINVAVFETGGCFWPLTFNRIIVGALVSQVTLIGILGLKKVAIESCVLIPLPFLTIWFWYYCDVNYTIKFNHPALIDAVLTDKDRVKLTAADKAVILSSGVIMRPVAEDILPLLMPSEFADCIQREKRIKAYSLDEAEEDAKLINVFQSTGKDAELADTAALRARLNQDEKKYLSAAVHRGRSINADEDDEDLENDPEAYPRGAQSSVPLTSLPASDSGASASVMSPLASETANKILASLREDYQRVNAKAPAVEEPEVEGDSESIDGAEKTKKPARMITSSEIGGAISGDTDDERMMARIALLRYSQPELAPVRFGTRVTSRVWPPVYLDSLRNEYNDKKGTQVPAYEVAVTSSERRNDAAAYNAADITGRALCPSGLDPNGSSSPIEGSEPVPKAVSSPRAASGKAFFPASPAATLAAEEAAAAPAAVAAAETADEAAGKEEGETSAPAEEQKPAVSEEEAPAAVAEPEAPASTAEPEVAAADPESPSEAAVGDNVEMTPVDKSDE